MTVINHETRALVVQMCRYVTDDSMIAAWTKVSRSDVARLRKTVYRNGRTGESGRVGVNIAKPENPSPIGLDADLRARTNAEQGSALLAKKIDALIAKTAAELPVPKGFNRREFAMAYLGMRA
jgi:hypothetical protein